MMHFLALIPIMIAMENTNRIMIITYQYCENQLELIIGDLQHQKYDIKQTDRQTER